MKRAAIILFISALFFSCSIPIETKNPNKAFKYWAGYNPPESFNIIHGEYYKSPHFTLEYKVYLELEPTSDWWNTLFDQKLLIADTVRWYKRPNTPDWFKPSEDSRMFSTGEDYDDSRYFIDRKTGKCFIYETYGGM